MEKDNFVYLKQILDFINDIEGHVRGITFGQFADDTKTQDAVLRKIEVIGEAANRLDNDFLFQYPNFPLSEAVSIRNKLIHEYDDIDLKIIWDTVQKDLAMLKSEIKEILQDQTKRCHPRKNTHQK